MKIILYTIALLLFTADGFMAIFSINKRNYIKRNLERQQIVISRAGIMDLDEEIERLSHIGCGIKFPDAVLAKRGFTGRGNPSLARNRYASLMKDVNKKIERIIQ